MSDNLSTEKRQNREKKLTKNVHKASRLAPKLDKSAVKYVRGALNYNTKKMTHKALRKTMEATQESIIKSAHLTATTEVLLTEERGCLEPEDNVKVYKYKQKEIQQAVDLNAAKNAFDLQLPNFGPYAVKYSRNGRYMLFGGRKGHVAAMDCLRTTLGAELNLQEDVYDVQYLQNETMFAVAQHRYTYIYDYRGVEIHCMRNHERPQKLDYLPYHFLLASVGHSGWIKWQDVSIGEYVAGYQTGHGPCRVLRHNPHNAVSHVGHSNGVVTLWSPSSGKALVSLFCHKSPVTDLAIDREGRYMTTSGMDGLMKVWDLRMYSCLHAYKPDKPVQTLDISDTGLVAMGFGREIQVLRGAFSSPMDVTYLKHEIRTPNPKLSSGGGATAATKALASSVHVHSVRFRPLEDVLGIGHSHGVTTILVPGAGEANFDSFENNPFTNAKQRQESEIQGLLYKLSPDMISLDSQFVGTVDKDQKTLTQEQLEIFRNANDNVLQQKDKNRARGRNKISAKLRRKQKNVVDAQTVKLREQLQRERDERERKQKELKKDQDAKNKKTVEKFDPLARFKKQQ